MTEQLEKNMYLLDHSISEKNILVHPRNPPPLEIKWCPPVYYSSRYKYNIDTIYLSILQSKPLALAQPHTSQTQSQA